jgi:CPA2 family monovalent cation:H+ antiporter-2
LPIFKEMGVVDIVLPEFEASLEMTRQALLHLRVPVSEIQRHTELLREDLFAPFFNAGGEYRTLTQLRTAEQQFDLQWVLLLEDSPLVARSIGEAEIRKTTGTSVVGVIRNGKLETNPDAHFRFQPNDLVAIIGTDQARLAFQEMAMPLRNAVNTLPKERDK